MTRQQSARQKTGLPVLAAAMVLVLSVVGCVRPSLSESAPRDPGRGVAWLIHRHLSQGFSLNGIPVETFAASGRYLIDVLLIPEAGEAYARIGPTLTVRDLNTGRPVWQVGLNSGFPAVTRDALYIGRRGYDLASGKQFKIPVGVPAGSIPDRSGDGVLAFTGPRAGRALADLNPRTGASRWQASAPRGFRFCGPLAANRSAAVVMRCAVTGSARRGHLVAGELDCFDPATGRLRWSHSVPIGWSSANLSVAVNGRTVMVAQDLGAVDEVPIGTLSMTVDAITGAVLPGLDRARAGMPATGSPILGLGPDRTVIVATRNASPQASRANRAGIRALRLIDLANGRVLWTARLKSPVGSESSLGFTSRTLYLLSGSEFAAYSLRTGLREGLLSLPVTFRGTWVAPLGVLIPAPDSGGPELIAGPRPGTILAGSLLISQTAEGGLAAVQTRWPSG
jgi:outer membrane protein assembly factor BamB